MMRLICPACQKPLAVQEALVGKKVKCPGCGQVIAVTAPTATAAGPMAAPQPAAPGDGMPAADQTQVNAPSPAAVGSGPAASASNVLDATTDGRAPDDEAQASLADFLSPPQAPDELGRLGKYRILQVLGQGGMGVVFKAEDPLLKRNVALKAMLPTLAASASAGQRFLREARAMAAVEHDHVVRVLEVAQERGIPYLAMEFLKGEPLDVRLEREQKLPVLEVVRIGKEIAEGLSAAHEQGLIHRDIKPANIWLEARRGEPRASATGGRGEPGASATGGRVKILDFGLARSAGQDSGLTQQGAIVGTPAYMAPEQARGETVDARCDLFSLGALLYRLSTGQPAFRGKDNVSTLMAVALEQPPAPRIANPELPAELSDLVMQLLEKDSQRRPASAAAVVQVLETLEKQLLRAQEPHDTTQSVKPLPAMVVAPSKRSRLPVLIGSLVLLAGLAGVGLWAAGVFHGKQDQSDAIVKGDDPGNARTKDAPAVAAAAAWQPGPAEDVLPGVVARPTKLDGLRRWQVQLVELTSPPRSLAWSGDGQLLAVGMQTGEVRVYGRALKPVRFLYGHAQEITALSWTKGGRLASASLDGTLRIWEPDGTPGPAMRDEVPVLAVSWRPDGTLLASGNEKGLVRLWQPDGTPERNLAASAGKVTGLSWSPDGQRLASSGTENTVRLWHADGKAGPVLTGLPGGADCVSWSPDGKRLATGCQYRKVQLWSADGQAGPEMKPSSWVSAVSWSPDSKSVLLSESGGMLQLWAPEEKPGVIDIRAHAIDQKATCVAVWSPDGQLIASAAENGLRLWTGDGEPTPSRLERVLAVASVAWSPDGQRLASGGDDRLVRLWGADGKPGPVLLGHNWPVLSVCWSPDGQRLASACYFNAPEPARLWNAQGEPGPVIRGASARLCWSPDGRTLLGRITGSPGGWRTWDAGSNLRVGTDLPGGGAATWSPDGQRIATGGGHNVNLIRRDGTVERSFDPGHVFSLSWSPDGRHIAVAKEGGVGLLTSDGQPGASIVRGADVRSLSWSPDSQRLGTGEADGSIRLWDTNGKAGPLTRAPGGSVLSLSWAKEGNRLASSRSDGTIRVCETGNLQPLWTAVVPPSRRATVFSPAGQMLHGHPALADEDLLYVAQTEAGRFELYTPTEFQKKALNGGRALALFTPGAAPPVRAVDDAWLESVRKMPATQQRDAVLARIRELNPGCFDPFQHREAGGRIVAVTLPSDPQLRDLSPLRALAGLEQLIVNGPTSGPRLPFADLKSLAGTKLKELSLTGTSVADLAPLAGMPLETLTLRNVPVADLAPLRSLPLKTLTARDTLVSDLSPLKGIASLKNLDVRGSPVTDLKPVQGLLLQSIAGDFDPQRDLPVLRAMPTLKTINDKPAAEF